VLNRKRLTLARQLYGSNDPRVAEVLVDLSVTMMGTQWNTEREGVLKEALAILDRNGDTGSQLRGNLMRDFAQWAYSYDVPQASRYIQRSVEILRRYPPSTDLTEALIIAGMTYNHVGEFQRADQSLTEAAAVARKQGERDAQLIRIHAYRSESRYFGGNWEGAQQDLRDAYDMALKFGGEEDPQTHFDGDRLQTPINGHAIDSVRPGAPQ